MSYKRYLFSMLILSVFTVPLMAADDVVSGEFSDWVPAGWKLIQTATGDLNKDNQPDAVIVIQQDNPANIKKNDGLGEPELDLNPRRLIVLLNIDAGYRQVLTTERFLPKQNSEHSPCLTDPVSEGGGVGINRGLLAVNLTYWLSCGSYSVSNYQFKFRYDNERFRLIGLDISSFSRSSGEQYETSVNYLTGKRKLTRGLNMFEESKPEITWQTLNPEQRHFYLDDMISSCYDDNGPQQWCE